jgi:hypothetical protein
MMHITAGTAGSGLVQIWSKEDRGPSVVTTSGWIFVVRGSAAIGSGPQGEVSPDATVASPGRWERIEGRSNSEYCPVGMTMIMTQAPDTEFYVTDVEVRAVMDAPACDRIIQRP